MGGHCLALLLLLRRIGRAGVHKIGSETGVVSPFAFFRSDHLSLLLHRRELHLHVALLCLWAGTLRAEMLVRLLAGKDRKQKRQVGVVRVQHVQLAEIDRIVARYSSEIGVQLVVGFRKQIAVALVKTPVNSATS